ncbi:acid protease [Violaceomyces palustris]|uniref:Acid protease n=1 Tax=Violaceomyces palustris TaxID=1673888 RepID=A0ACD0P696_9BASI|nr:acid protease [Violaceomyces palustris]
MRPQTFARLFCSLAALSQSADAASPPPTFFSHPDIHQPALVFDLLSSSHSSNVSPEGLRAEHIQREVKRARSKRSRFDVRADPSMETRQSGQSSSNPTDKIQSLGFLGNTYNFPLNLSSDPSQLVFVQIDTGSSDLWVVSASCATQSCRSDGVLKYDETRSGSFRPLTIEAQNGQVANATSNQTQTSTGLALRSEKHAPLRRGSSSMESHPRILSPFALDAAIGQANGSGVSVPFSITYDDRSSATGVLAVENFTMSDLSVTNQVFGLVNVTDVTLGQQGISGVLGLGFPRGSVISRSLINFQDQLKDARDTPIVMSLLQGTNVSYPLFGLALNRTGGRSTFGAVDPYILDTPAKRGQVEWHDVVPFPSGNTGLASNSSFNKDAEALGSYLSWTIRLTGAGVGGNAAELRPTYSEVGDHPLAVLDSGTSSLLGPASGVESIFSKIRNSRHVGNGQFVVPCDTQDRMYFSFGGRNLTLLPDDYIIGPASGQPFLCFAWPAASAPSSDGVDWVLGTPFLRSVYSIYSIGIDGAEAPKIGLYPLRQPANATASDVIFAPEPTESLSAYLMNSATVIASTLPNTLVPLVAPTSVPYAFANATFTPSIGLIPTAGAGASTYQPRITAATGDSSIPVIANDTTPLPVPSNPASNFGQQNGSSRILDIAGSVLSSTLFAFVMGMAVTLVSIG